MPSIQKSRALSWRRVDSGSCGCDNDEVYETFIIRPILVTFACEVLVAICLQSIAIYALAYTHMMATSCVREGWGTLATTKRS